MFTVLNSVHMLSTSLLWSVTPHVSKRTDSRRQTLLRKASHVGMHDILAVTSYRPGLAIIVFIYKHKHEYFFSTVHYHIIGYRNIICYQYCTKFLYFYMGASISGQIHSKTDQ